MTFSAALDLTPLTEFLVAHWLVMAYVATALVAVAILLWMALRWRARRAGEKERVATAASLAAEQALRERVGHAIEHALGDQLGKALEQLMRGRVSEAIEETLRGHAHAAEDLHDRVGHAIEHALGDRVSQTIEQALRERVSEAIGQALHGHVVGITNKVGPEDFAAADPEEFRRPVAMPDPRRLNEATPEEIHRCYDHVAQKDPVLCGKLTRAALRARREHAESCR